MSPRVIDHKILDNGVPCWYKIFEKNQTRKSQKCIWRKRLYKSRSISLDRRSVDNFKGTHARKDNSKLLTQSWRHSLAAGSCLCQSSHYTAAVEGRLRWRPSQPSFRVGILLPLHRTVNKQTTHTVNALNIWNTSWLTFQYISLKWKSSL